MSYGNAIWHCGTQEDNSKYSNIEAIAGLLILLKPIYNPIIAMWFFCNVYLSAGQH